MNNPRYDAIEESGKRAGENFIAFEEAQGSERFGELVFTRSVMQKVLPEEVYANVIEAMESRGKIKPQFADTIAMAMKDWALSHGATHYTHWFQPLTGASAEKHDAFIDWSENTGEVIDKFSGNQLLQGEPDASSFPSGGLRSTYEARGYTGWDPTSPVFLWKGGEGLTLCIPSIFFSWTGEVLDAKLPLLRSDAKINTSVMRLLKLLDIPAKRVYSTLGLEQEYFMIDRTLRNLRPDLLLLGKTVFGAHPSKGQQLQDHYLGSVKDRILTFMQDFELEAMRLSIPVKTRHNEVAPAQHEVAPVFEKASIAIDHNILLMEIMRHVAVRHQLCCLLHEKPFKGLNGSGKHSNWSLSTDTGVNLLDPSDTPGESLHFLILLAAILDAIHHHSALLRASIGSASNDYRLGGHEAPPAIISVFLGQEIEQLLDKIVEGVPHEKKNGKEVYDLGLLELPQLHRDYTDRNRTSPFAFTGNKFEFRAVGSSANPALAITVLNAIIAESLHALLDEIEKNLEGKKGREEIMKAALPVLRTSFKNSKPIRYFGDNYSDAWKKEAANRGLPNYELSLDAFPALKSKETVRAFEGILSSGELNSRYEVMVENYFLNLEIEINLMLELLWTSILPAALDSQKQYAKSIAKASELLNGKQAFKGQLEFLQKLASSIEDAISAAKELEGAKSKLKNMDAASARTLKDHMEKLRHAGDQLELLTDDAVWPLPKYRELLFVI